MTGNVYNLLSANVHLPVSNVHACENGCPVRQESTSTVIERESSSSQKLVHIHMPIENSSLSSFVFEDNLFSVVDMLVSHS